MQVRQQPRRHSLARRAAVRAAEFACVVLGGRALYRWRNLRASRVRVRTEALKVAGLPRELSGFRVVQLSDFHAGAFMGRGDLAEVVDVANALAPDVFALTGDFITHQPRELERLLPDLRRLRARRGAFAVFGNHDYRGRQDRELERALGEAGVRVLRNEAVRLPIGAAAVAIVGIEDLEESKHIDVDAARANVAPGDFEVVLCHHPGAAPQLAHSRCAVVLSGHTHGTQVDLPLLRRAGPAHPGLRVELGATTLVVSRGLGAIGLPLRFRAPAEVVNVTLEPR